MDKLTHTVSGSVVSFRSADRANIESLKVHFLPIQEGSGDPSPTNIRPISGWTGATAYQSAIPPQYQMVEWLGNSGTQYILTNYRPSCRNVKVEWKYMITATPGNTVMFGLSEGSNGTAYKYYAELYKSLAWYNGCGGVYYRNALSSPLRGASLNTLYSASMDVNRFTVDGYSAESSYELSDPTLNLQMCLFGYNDGSSNSVNYINDGLRLYSICFYENGILVANFVPCIRKSDDEPGMYDTVSATFYTNDGTGDFSTGPAVNVENTIPVIFPPIGKNLLNVSEVTSEAQTSSIVFGRTIASSYADGTLKLSAGTYTISFDFTATAVSITNASGTMLIQPIPTNVSYATFTITKEENIGIAIVKSGTSASDFESYHYQIESGSSATSYETFNNTFYGGYVDLINGTLVQTHAKFIDDGSEGTSVWEQAIRTNFINYNRTDLSTLGILQPYIGYKTGIFNYCKSPLTGEAWEGAIGSNGNNPNNYLRLLVPTSFTTIESFLAYLSEHPLEIIYELATPITYQLTPTQLKTFLNQNNIWSNANGNIEVTYQFQDHLLNQRMLVKQPHIATATGAIASFNTDMKAPLKEAKVYFNPIQEGSGIRVRRI